MGRRIAEPFGMMNHYTYKITVSNPTDSRKYYIGVRSCKCRPVDDHYFGSSDSFNAWQAENGVEGLSKEILDIWPSRSLAVDHEVWLHHYYDVSASEDYFNVAKQTSTGFDTTGMSVHTEERRKKISELFKNLPRTEEHKAKISAALKGRVISMETRRLLSEARKGKPSPLKGMSIGKGVPKSEEHKAKIGEANRGKKRSPEVCALYSKMRKGITPKYSPTRHESIECPHCGKQGMKANMKRYHFDNCKLMKVAA